MRASLPDLVAEEGRVRAEVVHLNDVVQRVVGPKDLAAEAHHHLVQRA